MPQLNAWPNPLLTSLVMETLHQRLAERLADQKGDFSKHYTPTLPYNANNLPPLLCDALLLPGTLSLAPSPTALLQATLPCLRPEGVVLGYVLGEGSFPELQQACHTAGFAPPPALPAVQDVGSLLQRTGLGLPVVDRDLLTLTFSSPVRLMHWLQSHWALQRPPHSGLLTQRRWQRLIDAWPVRADGKAPLTLEIIFFHALQPSAQLPQAAKRGSGKISLVKILGTPDDSSPCQTQKPS